MASTHTSQEISTLTLACADSCNPKWHLTHHNDEIVHTSNWLKSQLRLLRDIGPIRSRTSLLVPPSSL